VITNLAGDNADRNAANHDYQARTTGANRRELSDVGGDHFFCHVKIPNKFFKLPATASDHIQWNISL
jgi:hypothetical protein